MDNKIKVKEEDPLSLQNETDGNAVFLDDVYNMTIKTEIKSETGLPDCLQKDGNQFKFETVTCISNFEVNTKTEFEEQTLLPDFGSQNKSEFVTGDPLTKDQEVGNKIEIKEEHCCQESETSSTCDEIKDEDFLPEMFPRSCIEAVYGYNGDKSPLSCDDLNMGKDAISNRQESVEQSETYKNGEKTYSKDSINGNPEESSYQCKMCDKRFTQLSDFKEHTLFHDKKKPFRCVYCDKRFTHLSLLKMHSLIHENKKPYKCDICEKEFTRLSNLKRHNLIHEGRKEHKCTVCEKRFTHFSSLKLHNLIHEGKKPHECKICEKRFTGLSDLKRHCLIHEGKKPHKCTICDQKFTRLSNLKRHYLIHASK